VKPDSPPEELDGPLCGACGQHHAEGRGVCELDPMTFIPDIAATDEERRLRGVLYALNHAIMPDDLTFLGQQRNGFLEKLRDELWAFGADFYDWRD
jgi:hypothetical protein